MKEELGVIISATKARRGLKKLLGLRYKKVYYAGPNSNSASSKLKR
jgi:hypothetical protein